MDDFLREFHMRRREEAMAERGLGAWWQRFAGWMSGAGTSKWAYGAGLAYAAVLFAFVIAPREQVTEGPELKPASLIVPAEPADTGVQQLNELDLRPTSEGSTGEQEF